MSCNAETCLHVAVPAGAQLPFILLKHMVWQLALWRHTDNRLLSITNCKSPVALQLAVYALLGINIKVLSRLLPCPTHKDLIVCRLVDVASVTCTGLLP